MICCTIKPSLGKRAKITDSSQSIIADVINFDDSTGISIAVGNAVFKDTSQGTVVIANRMVSDKKTGTVVATEKPLMILKQDKDSIYVRADTLYSGKLPDSLAYKVDSVGNYIGRATSEIQTTAARVICRPFITCGYFPILFRRYATAYIIQVSILFSVYIPIPIAWASGFQVTGDTMYLYTKNKKPDHLYVFENGLIVGKTAENMYNQIKGKTIEWSF